MPPLRLVGRSPRPIERARPSQQPAAPSPLVALAPLFADLRPFDGLGAAGTRALVRDLAFALASLLRDERERALCATDAASQPRADGGPKGAVWEVGLERDGAELSVSVFAPGLQPRLAQVDHKTPLTEAVRAIELALAYASNDDDGGASSEAGLALAATELATAAARATGSTPLERFTAEVHGARRARLRLDATVTLRRTSRSPGREVLRADLHALLFRGDLRLCFGSVERTLPGAHVFLLSEQLVAVAPELLEAARARRGLVRRMLVGGASCGVRLEPSGLLFVSIATRSAEAPCSLPPIDARDYATAVASFGRALVRVVCRADRAQRQNLRVQSFRAALRALGESLHGSEDRPSLLNLAPDSYRAFAAGDGAAPAQAESRVGRLRFSESWRAAVPGLELRSVHLCGERLVVGSQRELACLERTTGTLLWQRPVTRALSIPSPVGLVRLSSEGRLTLHALDDGDALFDLELRPSAGHASGAVVSAPGLPRLLLVSEGERQLVAVDLDSGAVRWRRELRRSGRMRLRRAGRLLVVAAGEPELCAIDLGSGELVWRHRSSHRYHFGASFDRGELFAIAAGPAGEAARVELLDPWSGAVLWSRPVPRPAVPVTALLTTATCVLLIVRDAVRPGGSLGVLGFERSSGAPRFDLAHGLCEGDAACTLVDDLLMFNGERGELVAVDGTSGALLYRHVFALGHADRPHGLQPVLRSGALFVPQSEVYVVRPRDGTITGKLPSDLIPDLLRVDERCGVYVAEQSGHLVAYAALPALTVVRRGT